MAPVAERHTTAPHTPASPFGATSAWSPLRRTWFRALWTAQFVANAGTWAQTVGAQWLMGDLGGSALQVALVQTAATLPVFLLVVPPGRSATSSTGGGCCCSARRSCSWPPPRWPC
jgi:hypothetical protein